MVISLDTSTYTSSSTATTWNYWVGTTSTNAFSSTQNLSTSITSDTSVWKRWNSSTTTGASTTAWDAWTTNATTSTGGLSTWTQWTADYVRREAEPVVFVPSPRRRPSIDVGKARARADKLLIEHLTAEQELSLMEHGYFDVDTIVDGEHRRFRIHNNKYQHNVFEIDHTGQKIREYCAHTSHACPQSDHALAQKLMLEHNPQGFMQIANIWDLRGGRREAI